MNHIDLFAGIGGFALGFQRAGIETVAHVEIDKNCQNVIRKHWPDHLILSDVREAGKRNLPHADIVTFGSPCQDLSIAGKRAGLIGERSGLFHEAIRIIRELEPSIAVWENVPGALSSSRGEDFRAVLSEMLGTEVPMPRSGRWATAGMVRTGEIEVAWRILDAQYFGVPQRRRRVFVVRSVGEFSAAEILFEREGVPGNPPTRGKEGKVTSTLPASGAGTSRTGGQAAEPGFLIAGTLDRKSTSSNRGSQANETEFLVPEVAYSLRANPSHSGDKGDGGVNTTMIVEQNNFVSTPDMVSLRSDPAQPVIFQRTVGALQERDAKGIGTTIDDKIIAFSARDSGNDAQEDITPTLKSLSFKDSHQPESGGMAIAFVERAGKDGGGKGILENIEKSFPVGPQRQMIGVRRLTPVECERLQGFPDGWTEDQADTQRYKQLGNAVAVVCTEWLGRRIAQPLPKFS